ncbi:MAG: ATP-binding protein [Anaerolineaceae bacterium]|nr:ATP-binding protein [Anaerolineaceae bacterium]
MDFYRKAEQNLEDWRNSPYRKPLVLRGARQTGKTTLIKKFGKTFDSFIYLNLENDSDRKLFENQLSVHELIQYICLEKGIQRQGETLLFLDEIQYSARAVMLMRYFYEELPEIYVISAGSLLEIMMEKNKISFPVGRVEYLYLFPMNFEEFLRAVGEYAALEYYLQTPVPELAHDKLTKLFRLYSFIGGMPEAISRYAETRDLSRLSDIYGSLLTAYKDDVSKYASTTHESDVIRHVIETAPKESGNRIAFEKFGNSGYRSLDVGTAMRKLERAMLLYLRYPITRCEIPVYPDKKLRPRLQMLDSGLINYSLGIQALYFQEIQLSDIYRGVLAEQMVWQELLCLSQKELNIPTFWVREKKQSNAEVDFVYTFHGNLIPIEVKSGKDGTLKSLHQFLEIGDVSLAVRFYDRPFSLIETNTPMKDECPGKKYRLMNLPIYCTAKIQDYLSLIW